MSEPGKLTKWVPGNALRVTEAEVLSDLQTRALEVADDLNRLAVRTPCPICAAWLRATAQRLIILRNLRMLAVDSKDHRWGEPSNDNLMVHGKECREFWRGEGR